MDFKDWLKENLLWCENGDKRWKSEKRKDLLPIMVGGWLSVHALGEWAWQCLKECEEIECYFDQLDSNDNYKVNLESIEEFADHGDFINIHWEIAIACLGEKEVIRRLEENQEAEKEAKKNE